MSEDGLLYGTLLPSEAPKEIASIVESRWLGSAHVRGRLYDFGEFPGAELDPSSRTMIHAMIVGKAASDWSSLAVGTDQPDACLWLKVLHRFLQTESDVVDDCQRVPGAVVVSPVGAHEADDVSTRIHSRGVQRPGSCLACRWHDWE